MSGMIDTNILLYAVNTDAPQHTSAINFLAEKLATSDAWYLTEGIAYEFLRVSTHAKVFPEPLAWEQSVQFLQALWVRENVTVLTAGVDHWLTLASALPNIHFPAGNLFFDIRTYVLMLEHGVRSIYSADSDFLQFHGIDVINPLAAQALPD